MLRVCVKLTCRCCSLSATGASPTGCAPSRWAPVEVEVVLEVTLEYEAVLEVDVSLVLFVSNRGVAHGLRGFQVNLYLESHTLSGHRLQSLCPHSLATHTNPIHPRHTAPVHCAAGAQVPTASRTAKGVPVPQVLPLSADERISSVIPVEDFKDDEYLVLLTKVRRRRCYRSPCTNTAPPPR
jgi:hypothetical protein